MKKMREVILYFVVVLVLFTSCGKSQEAETGLVELNFWDLRTEETNGTMIDSIIAAFEEANPNISITRSAFKVEDLRNTIKPAINSGEGPDIFSYDSGAGYLGVLANSELAYDMTDYAIENGWYDHFYDWALAKSTYNDRLYGVTNELELLGVFYNKEIFSQAGVQPPETYQEFLDVCETLKSHDIVPFIAEDKDQWPGFHYESIWLNSFAGVDKVKSAIAGKLSWDNPDFAQGLDEFAELYTKGYAYPNPLSISYDDGNRAFYSGEAAMRITGTWMVGEYVEKFVDKVGFFYLPPANSDIPDSAPGGLGEAVVINNKSNNTKEALMFVDFMFNAQSIEKWYEAGFIPSVKNVDYSSFDLNPLFIEIIDEINSAENLGENIDPLMSGGVNSATQNYMQEVIAGRIDGAEAMRKKQEAFEKDIEDGNYVIE